MPHDWPTSVETLCTRCRRWLCALTLHANSASPASGSPRGRGVPRKKNKPSRAKNQSGKKHGRVSWAQGLPGGPYSVRRAIFRRLCMVPCLARPLPKRAVACVCSCRFSSIGSCPEPVTLQSASDLPVDWSFLTEQRLSAHPLSVRYSTTSGLS